VILKIKYLKYNLNPTKPERNAIPTNKPIRVGDKLYINRREKKQIEANLERSKREIQTPYLLSGICLSSITPASSWNKSMTSKPNAPITLGMCGGMGSLFMLNALP
jgi:hypothetical protein